MTKRLKTGLGTLLICLSVLTLYQLMALEYANGNAYPRYSSLRSDPLGTQVLYEALDLLPDISTERNMFPLSQSEFDPNVTLLLSAATLSNDPVFLIEKLEAHAENGGNLVIAFRPIAQIDHHSDDQTSDKDNADEEEKDEDSMEDLVPSGNISDRWGFDYDTLVNRKSSEGLTGVNVSRQKEASEHFPSEIVWHSALFFTHLDEEWESIYGHEENQSVVMERRWGKGRIVLCSDNYFLSNESLYKNRQSYFLTWALTQSPTVIFEESHLGLVNKMGITSLMLHYGLLPLILVLILMTLLFIWQNVASLVPRHAQDRDSTVEAFSHIEGMAHLARRAIPTSKLINTCWEMHRSASKMLRVQQSEGNQRIQKIINDHNDQKHFQKDAVTIYNHLHTQVNERKQKP